MTWCCCPTFQVFFSFGNAKDFCLLVLVQLYCLAKLRNYLVHTLLHFLHTQGSLIKNFFHTASCHILINYHFIIGTQLRFLLTTATACRIWRFLWLNLHTKIDSSKLFSPQSFFLKIYWAVIIIELIDLVQQNLVRF